MRKPLVLKCLFVVFVAVFLASWMGSAYDDDANDAPGLPDCQPAVFLSELQQVSQLEFAGYHNGVHPLMGESFTCFIEMHEKSPPLPAAFQV